MEFILASGNPHKASELADLFDPKVIKVKAADTKLSIEESGESYFENALLKARGYFEKYKQPVLADDSGLDVDVLPEELGISSARFGGEGLNDALRCLLLIEKLAPHKKKEQRLAHFTCVLCAFLSADEFYFFEGRVDGYIGEKCSGDEGFGYDPLFIPEAYDGHSSLAMIADWKQKNSHRAVASKHLQSFFAQRDCQKAT